MSATYLTPGVYVQELPGGPRAVEGVSTSNTLFAGYTLRGPVGEAVRVASWIEYEDRFGGRADDGRFTGVNDLRGAKEPVDRMGHSVLAYFQNGGRVAYIVRLVGTDAARAASAILKPKPLAFTARDAGTWANGLVVEVTDDKTVVGRHQISVGWLNAKGVLVPVERHTDVALQAAPGEERFIGDLIERESRLIRLARKDDGSQLVPTQPSLPDTRLRGIHRSGDVSGVDLDLSDTNETARTFKVRFRPETADPAETTVEARKYESLQDLAAELQKAIRADSGAAGPAEAREGFTLEVAEENGGRRLVARPGTTGPTSESTVLSSGLGGKLKFKTDESLTGAQTAPTATTAELFGGKDGGPAPAAEYRKAFDELKLNPDVNVVVVPNASWSATERPVVQAALAHCEEMGNRVAIIDPPRGLELADPTVVNGLDLPTSTYAQLYYPWVRVANPVHDPDLRPGAPVHVLVPPSGFVAGQWGRIDSRRGVWKAPAGVEAQLVGADGFEFEVGDPQQEVLNPAGVNVLRRRPGYGLVIWGARTLATKANPEWRYVPVRRLAIMIEESLRRGIQWAVFEPNDHRLWSALRLSAESYLDGLFRAGAFAGERASDAYRVSCGLGSSMTQGDVDRGYVVLRVQFAPTKPAEFVVIQIQQLAGQS